MTLLVGVAVMFSMSSTQPKTSTAPVAPVPQRQPQREVEPDDVQVLVPVTSSGPPVSNVTATVTGVWSSSGLTVMATDSVLRSLTWTPMPKIVVNQPSSEMECDYVVPIR